jgi:L-threonylcarbamoyladenylate synthase
MLKSKDIDQAVKTLKEGGIIAYPTEGVYGLGCDPFNKTAVLRLLKIKRRPLNKGLILIVANWQQANMLIKNKAGLRKIFKENKEPITWVFEATKRVPRWLKGKYNSIAIRATLHPAAKKICEKFGGAIVSTSANKTKSQPITKISLLDQEISREIDFILKEPVGRLGKATKICDSKTGKIIRK